MTTNNICSMDIFKIDLPALQKYVQTGSSLIDPEMEAYLEKLEIVRSMYSKYKSRRFIINTLLKLFPICEKQAYIIFNDALNFFYANNDVRKEAWRNIYAEKFENAAQVCWEQGNMEGYRRNLESAMKARGVMEPDLPELPKDFYDKRVIIYQMDPKMVGLEKVNRVELAKMIDSFKDVSEKDKNRLYQDAGIIDVEFFEVEQDEQNTAE